jgi:hypothetical protein
VRARALHSVKGQQVSSDISEDGSVPANATVSLTPFAGDQMFQRWLLDRVFHRHEMLFERIPPLPPITGFLTGMDDQYFSVSTSDRRPKSHVLPRHTVTGISETGVSLHELEQSTQVLIKKYTSRIRKACEEQLMPSRRIMAASARPSQQSI